MRQLQTTSQQKIRVYLIEQNPLLKRLIKARLKAEARIQVLGQQRLMAALPATPSVAAATIVLIDKSAAGPRFGTILRNIISSPLRCRIAILDNGDMALPDLCTLISLGVHGLLNFAQLGRQLVPAIMALSRGELWFPPSVLDCYVATMNSILHKKRGGNGEMTFRQQQITSLVKKGLSNKEISAALNISGSTVKFHLARIFAKLGVQDRRSILLQTDSSAAAQNHLPWSEGAAPIETANQGHKAGFRTLERCS
jgi:DNA-binding NarL/FixJ family response regulator